MGNEFTVAVTGDSIINRRISVHTDERFLSLIKIIRDADVGYTQLETLIHDYDGPETYPAAATGGLTWMRSPSFVVDELKWAGFDLVSHASNHTGDYSYGGLYSTWEALNKGGLPFAGTGRNLREAREPVYLETEKGRVALISMSSSFVDASRAGEARPDVKGRPGVNPLRYHYVVDAKTLEIVKQLAVRLGWAVSLIGKYWLFSQPGTVLLPLKFEVGDQPGISTKVNEEDAEGNLRSIKDARCQADFVMVHIHTHEWDPEKGLSYPDKFVTDFARSCIDAGADMFIAQGAHAPLRGIEIYKNKPIFYDTGEFLRMSRTVKRLPSEYYFHEGFSDEVRGSKATPADAYNAVHALPKWLNPPGGLFTAPVIGSVAAICSFGPDRKLTGLKLYPLDLSTEPRSQCGVPRLADAALGKKLIEHVAELSASFRTEIQYKDGVGLVRV